MAIFFLLAALLTGAFLAHQLYLICSGRTTYEVRAGAV
jgi:hypothetical protein